MDECTIQAIGVLLGIPKGALMNLPFHDLMQLSIKIHETITNKAAGQSQTVSICKVCKFSPIAFSLLYFYFTSLNALLDKCVCTYI
jgi:hypothetical protein